MNKENQIFYLIVGSFFTLILSAWYFIHPNSPWHERNNFFLHFSEIGTLSPGDPVSINGKTMGNVVSIELADSEVIVQIRVLSTVNIPTNSQVRISNTGLMGKRIVSIQLTNATPYMKDGGHYPGTYEMGATRMAFSVKELFRTLDTLHANLKNSLDSTLGHPETAHRWSQIQKKLKEIDIQAETTLKPSINEIALLFNALDSTQLQIRDLLKSAEPDWKQIALSSQQIISQIDDFSLKTKAFSSKLEEIIKRANNPSSSVGGLSSPEFRADLTKTSNNLKTLYKKIGEKGLDLNVDIF
jgi:phospholipid/cholesterol/gamma-HCH transport system substrate-binding protein